MSDMEFVVWFFGSFLCSMIVVDLLCFLERWWIGFPDVGDGGGSPGGWP